MWIILSILVGVVLIAWKMLSESKPLIKLDPNEKPFQLYRARDVPDSVDYIVIGAGPGGLVTAVQLAKAGYKVLVLEQHDRPGGGTHSFEDHGFEWDTGFHYLGEVATKAFPLNRMMAYLCGELQWCAMEDCPVAPDVVDEVYFFDANTDTKPPTPVQFKAGLPLIKEELNRKFPGEAKAIDTFYKMCDQCSQTILPYVIAMSLPKCIRFFLSPLIASVRKIGRSTTHEVLSNLTTNTDLMGTLSYLLGCYSSPPKKSSWLVQGMISQHFINGGAYPAGGAMSIPLGMCQQIKVHGGLVMVKASVKQILLDEAGQQALGVCMLKDDAQIFATRGVISASGVHATLHNLLPPKIQSIQSLRDRLDYIPVTRGHMVLFVGLNGTAEELSLPRKNHWVFPSTDHDANEARMEEFDSPLKSDEFPYYYLAYGFASAKDPTYAEKYPGKSSFICICEVPYKWFEEDEDSRPHKRGERTEQIKEKYAAMVFKMLKQQYPQVADRIEFYQVGTPLCNNFYLASWKGRSYGLQPTPGRYQEQWLEPRTPIKSLYFTGQDLWSDGLAGAMMGGLMCGGAIIGFRAWLSILWAIGPMMIIKLLVSGPPCRFEERKRNRC